MNLTSTRFFISLLLLFFPLILSSQNLVPFKEGELYGYKDSVSGKIIVPSAFKEAHPFVLNRALIKDSLGKYGYVDKNGRIAIPTTFVEATTFDSSLKLAKVFFNRTSNYIDTNGTPVFDDKYFEISGFIDGIAKVKTCESLSEVYDENCSWCINAKYGFINLGGEEIIRPLYNTASDFVSDFAIVSIKGKFGAVNKSGQIIIPIKYDKVEEIEKGFVLVSQGNKKGIFDLNGSNIIPVNYQYIDWDNGYFVVTSFKDREGIYNPKGKMLFPPNYSSCKVVNDHFILKADKNKLGIGNSTGKISVPFQYEFDGSYSEGLISVKKEGKYGFIDLLGNIKIPFIYDEVDSFKNGKALVLRNGKWGIINSQGKEIVPCLYNNKITYFFPSIALVQQDNLWGYIDSLGKYIIKPELDDAYDFYLNRTSIKKNGKFKFIDTLGKVIIPDIFDDVRSFFQTWTEVKKDSLWGTIDLDGKQIIPFIYDSLKVSKLIGRGKWNTKQFEFIKVWKNGKCGLSDSTGRQLQPLVYDDIFKFREEYSLLDTIAFIKKDKLYGVLNSKGEVLIAPNYDTILLKYDNYIVKKEKVLGIIDKNGKQIFHCTYDTVIFAGPFILFEKSNLWGIYSLEEKVIKSDCRYQEALVCYNKTNYFTFIKLLEKNKIGWLDGLGNPMIDCKYDEVGDFVIGRNYYNSVSNSFNYNEATNLVRIGNKWFIINIKGEILKEVEKKNIKKVKKSYF